MTAVRFRILALEALLFLRGLLFRGRRYACPVCGAGVRAFTRGGGSFRSRPRGYCPRCNSKARHRRVWLHCLQETDLVSARISLLHVAPKYCLSRRLSRMPNLDYSALDLEPGPNITVVGDLTSLEMSSETFDAIVCIHVLEHIEDDGAAIREMWRVLKPGGWAVVNVPMRLDVPTHEDASIVSAADRRRVFGEADHVRTYGYDLVGRLEAAGFDVSLFPGDSLDPALVERHGLTLDEHVLHCRKGVAA